VTQTAQVGQPDRPTVQITLPGWMSGVANPVMLAGTLLIAISLAVRIPILRGAYFVEDDFLFVGDAYEHDLTFDFLFRIHKGHLMPGALALTWGESRISAYNWLLVASVTFVLQALVAVFMLRLLRSMFGVRPGILLPLAVFLFSPLAIPAFSWWSAALNSVPLQLAMVLAMSAQVRYARGEGRRHARVALGWILLGMAFSTKAVFLPLLLFALTTAYLRAEGREKGWVASMMTEAREHWRLWAVHVLLMGGYTALYLSRQYTAPGEGAAMPKAGVTSDLLGNLLGRTFPAGIVGGPLSWGPVPSTGGLAAPSTLLVAAAWVALGVLVLGTLVYRRRAARAWLILAVYLVFVDAIPTVIARGSALGLVGAETRYVADAVVVFAVCLGIVLFPLRDEAQPFHRPVPTGGVLPMVAGLTAGAYLIMSMVSIENFRETLSGDKVRAYLGNVRTSLAKAPADAVIFSRPVPDSIVLPWNGARRLSHHLLAPLASPATRARMRVPEPSDHALVFDDAGRLVPVSVAPDFAQVPPPKKKCLPTLAGAVYWPEPVTFGGPDTVAGLAYSARRSTSLTIEVSGQSQQLNLEPTAGGLLHFPILIAGKGLLIRVDDPSAGVCLRGFAFGAAVPVKAPPVTAPQPAPAQSPGPGATPVAGSG
jgi:hypothetical protein